MFFGVHPVLRVLIVSLMYFWYVAWWLRILREAAASGSVAGGGALGAAELKAARESMTDESFILMFPCRMKGKVGNQISLQVPS